MKYFDKWYKIPKSFEGHCYVRNHESEYWLKKNKIRHKEDGPARIGDDGGRMYYYNDKLHRLNGPAVECDAGGAFFIENQFIHETDYWKHPLIISFKLVSILDSLETMITVTE